MAGKIRPGTGKDVQAEASAWRAARRRFIPSRWDDGDDGGSVACIHTADGGTCLVTLTGEHDLTTIPLLDHHTRHLWPRCRVAVIDLSGVTFMDTTIISWLLGVESALEDGVGFTLSIVEGAPGCAAARLFDHLRMEHVLACYPTVRAAFMQAAAGTGAVEWPPARSVKAAAKRRLEARSSATDARSSAA